jgi:hypothetical protein
MQKLKAGQETHMDITRRNGAVLFTILVSLFHDGVSLVFDNHNILNRSFTNLAEGRAYLRFLKAEAAAGTPLWLIVERAGAWTSAAAVVDDTEQALIDAINATLNEAHAELAANTAAQQARVAGIVNGPRAGWNAARNAANNTASRRIRPTRTNVHCQAPTPPQLDRMRQHSNGIVTVGDGQNWRLLDGIVQRGCAEVYAYWPGTRKIRAVRLNGRGWQAIGQQTEVAA